MASPPQLLKPAILIVSDTVAKDPKTDRCIPILKDVFAQDGKWQEPAVEIVTDDLEKIQEIVTGWTDIDTESTDSTDASAPSFVNLVVTSGGTGFAKRDFTPEAITPLIHRQAPGLVHAMLAASLEVTPFAMMARPVAGVRNKTLVITLPGSPKGAKENLEAMLKLLPHACMQAAGMDSRSLHAGGVKKLEKEAGMSGADGDREAAMSSNHTHTHDHRHHHHHHHDRGHGGHQVPRPHTDPSERPQSNDPSAGPTKRYRESPYPMLSVDEAVEQIIAHSPPPVPTTLPYNSPDLINSTVSESIYAKEAVPAYRASIVDGYAIIVDPSNTSATKGTFPVASVSHAQASSMPPPLQPGTIARITTGAPLPANANAVVMVEDTVLKSSRSTTLPTGITTLEEKEVEILTSAIKPGENIREPGSDISLSSLILPASTLITPVGGEIGLLAASGNPVVPVYRKPSIGILSTGDEVVDLTTSPTALQGGQIRDSNRPSLISLISSWNLCSRVIDLGIARDTPPGTLETVLRTSFRLHAPLDIIVTTGGVSMGELDLLKPTIERALGGTIHFGRVAMKPGKPTTFASWDGFKPSSADNQDSESQRKLFFGLPGNPASALVTACLFLLPALQKISGWTPPSLPLPQQRQLSSSSSSPSPTTITTTTPTTTLRYGLPHIHATLTHAIPSDPKRTEYHRVIISAVQSSPSLQITSTGSQRSSKIGSLARANGLLIVHPGRDMKNGDVGEVLLVAGGSSGGVLGF
ncbi:putative molybdenum cofactor biosynthesis protein [Phaeomoniella chlamydospora]|uniref:Putative molybdenum cofactor biosynthesis protein n=1 Tax=Phaeomoniella chlamydospora TaxID=158046 RepID=A0A0G2H2I8_PHACM|nr:putative molybdenum cofactor biosynthesis protein [Phaeomoniella chlamydospora]